MSRALGVLQSPPAEKSTGLKPAQVLLREKDKMGTRLPDIRNHYKAAVIKTVGIRTGTDK